MKIDQNRIKASRIPLTGIIVLVVVATAAFVLPKGAATGGSSAVAIEPGDQGATPLRPSTTATSQPPVPEAGLETSTTLLPQSGMPAPQGGLRPEWPEWVSASGEKSTATAYSAALTLTRGDLQQLLVWLSMEGWTATGADIKASDWALLSGGGLQGTLVVTSPTTFRFATTKE